MGNPVTDQDRENKRGTPMSDKAYFAYTKNEQGICIQRCYAAESRIEIPAEIEGLPVVEIASYAFAQMMESEPENTGDFPCICGELAEEIFLPPTIKRVGRYVFYNCWNLKKLGFSTNISYIGAGVFTGCKSLKELVVSEADSEKSCLREVLVDLNRTVIVDYRGQSHNRILYPAFFEEAVENTPARIIETHTHGVGIQYRNAFKGTQIDWKEYDRIFTFGKYNMEQWEAIATAAYRLMAGNVTQAEAEKDYTDFLRTHLKEAGKIFADRGEREVLSWLAEAFVADSKEMDALLDGADKNAEMTSLLINISHKRFKPKAKGFTL